MTSLEQTVEDIRKMRVRGALDIAIAAVNSLTTVAQSDSAQDTKELIKKLTIAAKKLKGARPTAVSLPNAVNYIIYLAEKNKHLPLAEFRNKMICETERFVSEQEKALITIAKIGSNLIEDGDIILTHCNSDTVVEILKKAWDEGKKIEVVCTESRPRYQGLLTAKALTSYGIPTTLIVDSAVHLMMKKMHVDKVIVGADTLCANGDLLNKIGTSQVALCAKELNIDFIVATESIKFSPQSLLGSIVPIEERDASEVLEPGKIKKLKIRNPAFDITDVSYISMIITEYGVIPPQAVYHILKEKFGWELGV
jgi:ribose 1,5-bisphosphate isomerase